VITLVSFPIASGSAAVVWEEDFSGSLNEWDLKGYTYSNWQTSLGDSSIDSGLSIEDGILVGTFTGGFIPPNTGGNWSVAHHSSDVVYGSWELDLSIEPTPWAQNIDTEIYFIYSDPTNNYDWLGKNNDLDIKSTFAYVIYITNKNSGTDRIDMYLSKHRGGGLSRIDLDHTSFDIEYDTFYPIKITRTLDYKIEVSFDGELKLDAQETEENALTISERFVFFHINGRYKLDNIKVSDVTPPTTNTTTTTAPTTTNASTNGFLVLVTGLSVIALVITRIKRKD
jgi:hypothetical protein